MKNITTRYGILKGLTYVDLYPDGSVKDCVLTKENELKTPYGDFIPQFEDDGVRRKQVKPLSFYRNGNLKSISLQNPVEVMTSAGVLPAEFITFYESGSIRRVFPLDGKLSGYWDEADEYKLAGDFEFNFAFGKLRQKVIGIHFYENGAIKSLTFWPKATFTIQTPVGPAAVRIGIALYPDGMLKSYEPAKPTDVDTPVGKITAYDSKALGIHGDSNSLRFSEDGRIEQVVTSVNRIEVTDKCGRQHIYEPGAKPALFNGAAKELVPLSVQFYGSKVRFNNSIEDEYDIAECTFSVGSCRLQPPNPCSSCSGCAECCG